MTGNREIHSFFNTRPEFFKNKSNTISLYQTCIMIMTITAISSVDFRMFPARFRKSKTFGISLVIIIKFMNLFYLKMDIGVSLIISASGLVMTKYLHGTSKLDFKKVIKSSGPLLVLGIIKAAMSVEYNLGAVEYGKHWSFFMNLAFMPVSVYLASKLPSIHIIPFICVFWMTSKICEWSIQSSFLVYQYLLTKYQLGTYLLNPGNESFFEQNKIGIVSLPGTTYTDNNICDIKV